MLPLHTSFQYRSSPSGFTLIEALLVVAILAVLLAIALPRYQDYVYRTEVAQAVQDISALSVRIKHYQLDERAFPDDLADIGADQMRDSWGYPYRYVNLTDPANKNEARKDKHLHPLNSDFDLYNIGRDGKTVKPLTAQPSHDDVLRAYAGTFIGLGKDY